MVGHMVGARGIEPPASASRRQRSTRLSYAPTKSVMRLYAAPSTNATVHPNVRHPIIENK